MIKSGGGRIVLLVGWYALKVCRLAHFAQGLEQNRNEIWWWRNTQDDRLCPILFNTCGGGLLIMRRAQPIPREKFDLKFPTWSDLWKWAQLSTGYEGTELDGTTLPHELKIDCFGIIDDRLVIVDYGNSSPPNRK